MSEDLRQTLNAAATEAAEYLHFVVSGQEYCSPKVRLEAAKVVLRMTASASHTGTPVPY